MWLKKTSVYLAVLWFMCSPLSAFAHATPLTYTPAASATEVVTPASISIRFTERIEVGASSLKVFAPDGSEVNQGKGELDPADGRTLVVPITDAGEGVYAVSWQVVSVDDGHFTKGAYSFLVDATGKAYEGGEGGVEISYSSKLPDAIFSFLNLVGESLFVAVILFAVFLTRSVRKHIPELNRYEPVLQKIFTHLLSFGYIFFVVGGMLGIIKKSAELASLQSTNTVEALLTYAASSVGMFSVLKIITATAFFAIFLRMRTRIFTGLPRLWAVILFGLLGTILYMQSYVSHAAASLFMPKLSIAVTFVHLVSKELIIGSICVLCCMFFVFFRKNMLHLYAVFAARFDLFFAGALGLASVSGVFITWLHLKHGENLFATDWGMRFITLLLFTALFGALRLLHQFLLIPNIKEPRVQRSLFFTLSFEVAVALCVLFLSGYISLTTPPFTVAQYDFSQEQESEGVDIELRVHPYEHESMLVTFTDARTGEPLDPTQLTITILNEEKGVGPNQMAPIKRFDGGYVFPLADLVPQGAWEVTVQAGQKGGYDAHGAFSFVYPEDIENSLRSDDVRVFDKMAVLLLWIGAALAVFCLGLFLYSYRSLKHASFPAIASALYSPLSILITMILAAVVIAVCITAGQYAGISSFQKRCIADGFVWRQAFPARDFEATSPNAVLGCAVHDGHYHFADEREYDFFMKTQHE